MTDRHLTHRESLEQNAYLLQLQIDFHIATFHRTKKEMTDEKKESCLVIIGDLQQELINTKRKLRAMQAMLFPTSSLPTQPTKGENDISMIYTPTFEDTDHEE